MVEPGEGETLPTSLPRSAFLRIRFFPQKRNAPLLAKGSQLMVFRTRVSSVQFLRNSFETIIRDHPPPIHFPGQVRAVTTTRGRHRVVFLKHSQASLVLLKLR